MCPHAYGIVVAALMAAAVLSACSEAPARDELRAYVASADQWIDRCAKLRRGPEETSNRREAACVRDAHESVDPLYLAASASVRGQRGTTMYLERYRAEWNAAMTALGHSGPTNEQESTIDEERKALHDIALKLSNG
jgi:hypothetical protein